jgi:hypothetical protein
MKKDKNLEQKLDNEKLHVSNDWALILDDFRKTDLYRKSNGQLLFPKFFEWISENYEVPKKLK